MSSRMYLELADAEGNPQTFFEVVVRNTVVEIRYGDVGTAGQTKTKDAGSAAAAQAEASRLVASRRRKGYADAVPSSGRARRASTTSSASPAPVRWRFDTGRRAFAVCATTRGVWVGNEAGQVFLLGFDGATHKRFRLPDGVKCIVADDDWLYAGCDDGGVYDLTGGQPVQAYSISSSVDIYWLDVADAVLGVSDADGNVFVFNHEDQDQWKKRSDGSRGWMICCDEVGVYHGHSDGVTMYDWEDGEELWHRDVDGAVLYGAQHRDRLYVATSQRELRCLSKLGHTEWVAACDASVYCCVSSADGQYLFAGDSNSSVYCFDRDGNRLWKHATGCGSAISMSTYGDRLFIVTTSGLAAAIDLAAVGTVSAAPAPAPRPTATRAPAPAPSPAPAPAPAPAAASRSSVASAVSSAVSSVIGAITPRDLRPVESNAKLAAAGLDDLEETTDASGGVVVECYEAGGGLWVRVASSGYRADWLVQFPKNLRVKGERFVVDEIREASRGSFYRAYGSIRRLK